MRPAEKRLKESLIDSRADLEEVVTILLDFHNLHLPKDKLDPLVAMLTGLSCKIETVDDINLIDNLIKTGYGVDQLKFSRTR